MCLFVWFLFQWLISRARDLIEVMTNKIVTTSRGFNRRICAEYDSIVRRITTQSESTQQLVSLQEYLAKLPMGELLQLKVLHELLHLNPKKLKKELYGIFQARFILKREVFFHPSLTCAFPFLRS